MTVDDFELRPPRPEVRIHENINVCFRTQVSPAEVITAFREAYRAGRGWGFWREDQSWETQYALLHILAIPNEFLVIVTPRPGVDPSDLARWMVDGDHLQAWTAVQAAIAVGEDESATRGSDEVAFGYLSGRQVARYVPVMRGLTQEELAQADLALEGPLSAPEGASEHPRKRRWFR